MSCCTPYTGNACGCNSGSGVSLYCTVMSDTIGVVYRAFSALPKWMGGSGSPSVDPWTKNILKDCETQQLVRAGMPAACAANQACKDVNQTIATAPSLQPAACNSPNILLWIAIIVGGAILLMIFGNAAAKKAVGG